MKPEGRAALSDVWCLCGGPLPRRSPARRAADSQALSRIAEKVSEFHRPRSGARPQARRAHRHGDIRTRKGSMREPPRSRVLTTRAPAASILPLMPPQAIIPIPFSTRSRPHSRAQWPISPAIVSAGWSKHAMRASSTRTSPALGTWAPADDRAEALSDLKRADGSRSFPAGAGRAWPHRSSHPLFCFESSDRPSTPDSGSRPPAPQGWRRRPHALSGRKIPRRLAGRRAEIDRKISHRADRQILEHFIAAHDGGGDGAWQGGGWRQFYRTGNGMSLRQLRVEATRANLSDGGQEWGDEHCNGRSARDRQPTHGRTGHGLASTRFGMSYSSCGPALNRLRVLTKTRRSRRHL